MYKSNDNNVLIWYGASLSTPYEGWPCLSNGDIKPEVPLTPGLLSAEQVDHLNDRTEELIDVNLVAPEVGNNGTISLVNPASVSELSYLTVSSLLNV